MGPETMSALRPSGAASRYYGKRTATAAIALALGIWTGVAGSGATLALSLEEALSAAYQENPTLNASRAQLRGVNEQVPQALSNWRPQVTVSGSTGQSYLDSDTVLDNRNTFTNPLNSQLSVSQPLYRGGRTVADTSRAENDVRSERERLRSVEQSVLLQAVTAYMDVWRDESVLELNINNEQVLDRQLEASRDRFSVGEITRTDVAQSESRLARATADRVQAEGNLTTSRAIFREIIGLEPANLERPPQAQGIPESQQLVVALAQTRNPNVVAAEFAALSAQDETRARLGELLPTVSLEGSLQHNKTSLNDDEDSTQVEVLAQVTVPIYQSGFVYSRIREGKQLVSQRRQELDEARRRAEQEAISSWESLTTARAQIESFKSQVRSNEIALDGVRQENAVGARTILDILDAEQELLDSQVSLVRAERDEVVANYEVLGAVGRLSGEEVRLPVELYDSQADYNGVRDSWFGAGAPGAEE